VQRAFILCGDEIGIEALPLPAAATSSPEAATAANPLSLDVGASMPEVERRVILATLDHFGGDKKKAAEVLKISVKKIYNRLREYRSS